MCLKSPGKESDESAGLMLYLCLACVSAKMKTERNFFLFLERAVSDLFGAG